MECTHEREHEVAAARAAKNLPAQNEIERLASQFKTICEPSRLKILFALREGEMCVYHIVEAVGGNQSAVSHQLRILRDNRMIKSRREGQNILYSLADAHVLAVLELALAHAGCEGGEE